MSLAAFQFFSKFSNTEIYYQSFNQDIFQLYPVEKPITTKASVNLVEVLVANGFEAEETGDLLKDYEFNKSFYSKCLKENNSGLKVIADVGNVKDANGNFNLSKMYNAPGYFYNSDVDKAINIVKFCGFNPESLTGEQISYITGGWFEEYVFQFIMNTYKIPEGNIALNMKIERNNDKNELDVVYITSDNKIHIIECKALVKKNDNTKVISDAIYKLKSLTTKFGLKVQGHIYTKAKEINQMYRDRADDLGIEIVDGTLI